MDLYAKDDYNRQDHSFVANMWHDFKDERGKAIKATEKQAHLNTVEQKFKVRIRQGDISVWQPLPDEFGFTISNTFEEPFGALTFGSAISKYNLASKVFKTGLPTIQSSPGLAMKKSFMGPEPSEISLELEFNSYYNAVDEVIVPVLKLLRMGCVSEADFEQTWNDIKKVIGDLWDSVVPFLDRYKPQSLDVDLQNEEKNAVEYGDKAQKYIQFLEAPKTVDIYFGDVYRIKNAFIQSYQVSFSNNVDVIGAPIAATVNLTFALQDVPTRERVFEWFDSGKVSERWGGF